MQYNSKNQEVYRYGDEAEVLDAEMVETPPAKPRVAKAGAVPKPAAKTAKKPVKGIQAYEPEPDKFGGEKEHRAERLVKPKAQPDEPDDYEDDDDDYELVNEPVKVVSKKGHKPAPARKPVRPPAPVRSNRMRDRNERDDGYDDYERVARRREADDRYGGQPGTLGKAFARLTRPANRLRHSQVHGHVRIICLVLGVALEIKSTTMTADYINYGDVFLRWLVIFVGVAMELLAWVGFGSQTFKAICWLIVAVSIYFNIAAIHNSEHVAFNLHAVATWQHSIVGALLSVLPEPLILTGLTGYTP